MWVVVRVAYSSLQLQGIVCFLGPYSNRVGDGQLAGDLGSHGSVMSLFVTAV